ncbi:MAG: SDR family oxidoreductase [Pseudomonadales bacterium]
MISNSGAAKLKIMITGANGRLGRKLIKRLLAGGEHEVVAVVRSERAAEQVRADGLACTVKVLDYGDSDALKAAGADCGAVVHLVGIIKESRANTFHQAHEAPCQALLDAGLAAERMIYLGVLGTDLASRNACFRSRANAERILASGPAPTIVLRVPMVLGADDYASRSLIANAKAKVVLTWRAAAKEQPIAGDDVIKAILAALEMQLPTTSTVLSLSGAESISRKTLIERAAKLVGGKPSVISLPLWLGMALAWLLERLMPAPPITRAMLGVLDHDDAIDPLPATRALGITLTPLDKILRALLTS